MRIIDICIVYFAIAAWPMGAAARELAFLQTDPRFTGAEFNVNDPAHPNFWFYDQYSAARAALQADGINLVPVKSITLANLTADSDAFFMPPPSQGAASAYPLSDAEISVLQRYVAGGRTIIFNLGAAPSAEMDNDLLHRLGLHGTQAAHNVSGKTAYPIPSHPVLAGSVGAVGGFDVADEGYLSDRGSMRSLVDVGGKCIVPYVEKGDLRAKSGAYIFILDERFLMDWNARSADRHAFFLNLVNYAAQDQYLHFVPKRSAATKP
jgi:hypothetical protein